MALQVNAAQIYPSPYCVVTTRLDSGEVVPVLVESSTWIPVRLATRWVLLHKRLRSATNTLRKSLFTLKLVYCWARNKGIELDELLLAEGELSRDHIKSLVAYLQNFRATRTRTQVLLTAEKNLGGSRNLRSKIANARVAVPINPDLAVIENFLSWISDPINIGFKPNHSRRMISIERVNSAKATVRASIEIYRVGSFPSRRPQPLSLDQVASIHSTIDPIRASRIATSTTSLFPRTPWILETCLRNWLMFCLAEQHGLRIGEILKLTLEDIVSLTPGGPLTVHVRRRPDDPHDTRTNPPAVKTVERVLELATQLCWGFRLYLTRRPPLGRAAGNSPYMFVTATGIPLSYLSAYRGLQVLAKRVGISDLCWHMLRHTWAESLARELFAVNGMEEHAIETLRCLGGWSERSHTPFHYIRNAIHESANDFLRKRNERMYQLPSSSLGTLRENA
jgi:integrase